MIAAAAVFWVTMALDSGWFALQHLELPVEFRIVLLLLMLVGSVFLFCHGILIPLLRRFHDHDLAVLLERCFPEYQDRLITAVEGARGLSANGPLVAGMLTRTVSDAAMLARSTYPGDVFDPRLLRRRSWVAVLLVLSITGFGAVRPDALPRWWNAFVRCESVYHTRTTRLDVRVVAQPGDRRLSFRTENDRQVYLHPRGNDLELELTVPEGNGSSGRPWVVPDRVRVHIRRSDGTTSRTWVSANSGRMFRFVVTRLQGDVELELLAGDFRTRHPLQVRSVTPPSIDTLLLQCEYPAYTQWNQLRATEVPVAGSESALPIGTSFRIEAKSGKPLQQVRIVTDAYEITGDANASRIIRKNGNGSSTDGPAVLSEDGRTVMAAFFLTSTEDEAASVADNREQSAVIDPAESLPEEASPAATRGCRIASNTSVRFFLHDTDDVLSTRPQFFRVRGIPDRPPTIDVRLVGVGNAITRRAAIPFAGSVRDDYGLRSAGFEFVVDDETQWRPRPFSEPLTRDTAEYVLGGSHSSASVSGDAFEVFRVQPLDLTEGQTLSLAVTATDGCTIGGANIARGNPLLFRIVSNEELLSLLYTREISLRRRFEEVVHELQQARDDLAFHEQVARRLENPADEDIRSEDHIGLATCATRGGNVLRRQMNELKSILLGFDGIIRQLINNSVPPARLSETMKESIVMPLEEIVEHDLPAADHTLSRFRVAAVSREPATLLVIESEQAVGQVIARLKLVLDDVKDMAEFHEALSDLKALLEGQKRVLEDTKQLRRRRLIDEL